MRDIDQGWMDVKLGVIKASSVSMREIEMLDIFDFFIMLHELDQKAEKQRLNGRRG